MKTLYQQLFYEGVKEEMGQSSELLYVSVENQLLSHLPYIIALDHTSRQVTALVSSSPNMNKPMNMRGVLLLVTDQRTIYNHPRRM